MHRDDHMASTRHPKPGMLKLEDRATNRTTTSVEIRPAVTVLFAGDEVREVIDDR